MGSASAPPAQRGFPMRYSAEHKRQTRQAILDAAGRVFRAEGYGGSGIDALTKAAGVTNGAFYGHFATKAEAFRAVVGIGLDGLRDAIAACQAEHGKRWLDAFVAIYLGPKLTCEIGDACTLPLLSAEVARSDDAARAAYESEFARVVEAMAAGLNGDQARALAILSLLSGAATFARAVADPQLRARIVEAASSGVSALANANGPAPPPPVK